MTLATASLVASIGGSVLGAIGAMQQGQAAQAQANYQAAILRNNAILAQRKADDARARGRIEATQQREASRLLLGRQKAVLAGTGVDVAGESAVKLRADTAALGELDALTILSNAEREALGFEARGMSFEAEARGQQFVGVSALAGGRLRAGASLLTGFGSVAEKWSAFKDKTGAP